MLLHYFVQHPEQVVSRAELLEQVWQNAHVSEDAINRCVSILRKVLGGERNRFISTVPKVGYRFHIPENVTFELSDKTNSNQPVSQHEAKVGSNPDSTEQVNHSTQLSKKTKGRYKQNIGLAAILSFCMLFMFTRVAWTDQDLYRVPIKIDHRSMDHGRVKLAIMPFKRLSTEQDDQFFVAGLTEEIINSLYQQSYLQVVKVPDPTLRPTQPFILQGSVRIIGDTARITVQLLDTNTSVYLVSTVFERQLNDPMGVQLDISDRVANMIQPILSTYTN